MKRCTQIWIALIFLTILTLFIGETGLQGKAIILTLLGVTFLKAQMIVDYFMGLRNVRWFWRIIMFSWLFLVLGLISVAFLKG